ncbi:MAG: PLD nuclease N-terminal domain-containing protein [Propionibacteriaceae bacterium]
MGRVVVLVAVIGLGVYAFVAALQADGDRIRVMPRWLWLAVILSFPVVGPFLYLFTGQPTTAAIQARDNRPMGPDDDPDFLRKL